ncbi:MAG TPA: peptide ABC transporter substrate-binding protein [Oscillatoriaceae cyanobacterium]
MKRTPLLLLAGLVLGIPLLLLAGHPVRSGEARGAMVSVAQEPDTLDPYLSPQQSTSTLAALFYSGLVSLDDHGRWIPDLAERVPTLENGGVTLAGGGMRVKFRLRPNLRWQDGQPLTSADVAATWKLVMDRRFPTVSTEGYDRIARIETPDPRTAVMVFKTPYAPYLELLPFILPAHVIAASANPAQAAWNRQPLGSGPYRLTRWVSGEELVMEANPYYYKGTPGIAHLAVRFVPHPGTAFAMFRAGELDLVTGVPPQECAAMRAAAPGRVFVTPTSTWEHVVFNLKSPILADKRVRQAIARLIDRKELADKAYGRMLTPAYSEVPTVSWAYDPRVATFNPYDPTSAGALLDAAGWKRGPDGIRVKDGRKLTLGLLTTSDNPSRALAAQIWRRQWRSAGISLDIEQQPASAVFGSAATGGRLATGKFDLALVASVSRPDPDSSYRWRSDQVPPNGANQSRYANPVVDRLLDEGQQTIDRSARVRLYAQLAEHLADDLPVVPLLYTVNIDATSKRLVGFRPNPTLRGDFWNVSSWKLGNP